MVFFRSSQHSPAYSESSGQWSASGGMTGLGSGGMSGMTDTLGTDSSVSQPPPLQSVPSTPCNQKSSEKMKADESNYFYSYVFQKKHCNKKKLNCVTGLGSAATISAVLYANLNHPEWKNEFPNWPDRCKQILKKWRALASDKKTPYLQQAKDNRGAIRMKKAQQVSILFNITTVGSIIKVHSYF